MKRLVITLMLIFSSIIFSQSNYEILPIKQHLNDIYIIRMLEGENIGLYSIIDSKGNLLTQTDNILISVQKNHIYLVTKDYKEGLMTTDGKWIAKIGKYNFKEKYSNMYKEAENNREKEFFIVYINEMPRHKYGYINYKGELQIPIIYDEAENFSEGLAAVKLNNKWGYIDTEGNVKIGFNFDEAYDFKNDLALVRIDDTSFYIDKNGQKKLMKSLFREGKEKIENLGYHIGSAFEGKLKIKEKTN